MTEKELIAHGIGNVPSWLADQGLELAVAYFEENDLEPQACFEAKEEDFKSELASHWYKAEHIANRVLTGDAQYDNSFISLDYDIF